MSQFPKFRLYGQDDPVVEEKIQPHLFWRDWKDLLYEEKAVALQQLKNDDWINEFSDEILNTIEYLNKNFLRILPGKQLHAIIPIRDVDGVSNNFQRRKAAFEDFKNIFISQHGEELVFRMLSFFAREHIRYDFYGMAERETEIKKRCDYVDVAFGDFDKLADCFNLIFEQFNVNVILTRDGLIPRQDPKIVKDLYLPILKILADPKWKSVSEDLASMFEAYLSKNFAESITKAHVVMQRFLQILLGREEGKNAKGEMKDLFHSLKEKSHIPFTKLGESITKALSDFMSSQRALISTAKPSMQNADRSDALVTMNVLMVYLQHCLTITYVPQ
jgi:hypothetical protein